MLQGRSASNAGAAYVHDMAKSKMTAALAKKGYFDTRVSLQVLLGGDMKMDRRRASRSPGTAARAPKHDISDISVWTVGSIAVWFEFCSC